MSTSDSFTKADRAKNTIRYALFLLSCLSMLFSTIAAMKGMRRDSCPACGVLNSIYTADATHEDLERVSRYRVTPEHYEDETTDFKIDDGSFFGKKISVTRQVKVPEKSTYVGDFQKKKSTYVEKCHCCDYIKVSVFKYEVKK